MQILIIENRAKPNYQIHHWVKTMAAEKVIKSNGIEALVWLGKGNIPSVIFADVDMGLIQGQQFVEYVRANGFFYDIPIVVLAEAHQREDIASMIQAGANEYLVKPIFIAQVEAKISKLMLHQDVA